MTRINNNEIISQATKDLELQQAMQSMPQELADKIVATYNVNSKGKLVVKGVAYDTILAPPTGKSWVPLWAYTIGDNTATVGSRMWAYVVFDDPLGVGNVLYSCRTAQASTASQTSRDFLWTSGNVGSGNNQGFGQVAPLLNSGQSMTITDRNAIDPLDTQAGFAAFLEFTEMAVK